MLYMCNIAGYIGTKDAAPILWTMMARESGYGGGYYSGLATISDGKLYSAKVLGDLDRLEKKYPESRSFPGTIGIIHSRSNSGGDDAWSHPFISNDNTLAYVANGAMGYYAAKSAEKRDAVAQQLEHEGIKYVSAADPVGSYPRLSNGQGVHTSEVMAHLIRKYISEGKDPEAAIRTAFENYPSEIVGLTITTEYPDAIYAARFNQPMMIGEAEDGIYLATTAIAFPEDVTFKSVYLLPAGHSATITRSGVIFHEMKMPLPVSHIEPEYYYHARLAILDKLSNGECRIGGLCDAAGKVFPEGIPSPTAVLTYEVLRGMLRDGIVETIVKEGPGHIEGVTTSEFWVRKI